MAIVIPSKRIYSLDNNKILANAITGVSISENLYEVSNDISFTVNETSEVSHSDSEAYSKEWYTVSHKGITESYRWKVVGYFYTIDYSVTSATPVSKDTIQVRMSITTKGNQHENFAGKEIELRHTTPSNFINPAPNVPDISYTTRPDTNNWGKDFTKYLNELFLNKPSYTISPENASNYNVTVFYLKKIEAYMQIRDSNGNITENEAVAPYVDEKMVSFSASGASLIKTIKRNIGIKGGVEISLDESEFTQATPMNSEENATSIAESLANEILEDYIYGKETVKFVCSFSDYLDTEGNIKISLTDEQLPMMLGLNDEIIPLIWTANGIDAPISIKKSGNPKIFKIVSVAPKYDGVANVEITAIETNDDKKINANWSINGAVLTREITTRNYGGYETDINIETDISEIAPHAFEGFKTIKSVSVSPNTDTVGEYAFSGCENLITFPEAYGIRRIGKYAFKNCKKLAFYDHEEGLDYVGEFYLKDIEEIEEGAFYGCEQIYSVVPNQYWQEIPNYAFCNCIRLGVYTNPDNIRRIGDYAFSNTALESTTILQQTLHIGYGAYKGTTTLKYAIFKNQYTGDDGAGRWSLYDQHDNWVKDIKEEMTSTVGAEYLTKTYADYRWEYRLY